MRVLNKNQFLLIAGQPFTKDNFFNPILDADSDIVISDEEVTFCDNPEFEWVKQLSFKEYKPIQLEK